MKAARLARDPGSLAQGAIQLRLGVGTVLTLAQQVLRCGEVLTTRAGGRSFAGAPLGVGVEKRRPGLAPRGIQSLVDPRALSRLDLLGRFDHNAQVLLQELHRQQMVALSTPIEF
ncbi:MAG: hypothetical protein Q4F49_08605 [Pseudoxanthomonas suwonensis]|nr:hypothetical protein [Pseudoxanthomonas suwonensis]